MNGVFAYIYSKLQEAETEAMTTTLRFSSVEILNAVWEMMRKE